MPSSSRATTTPTGGGRRRASGRRPAPTRSPARAADALKDLFDFKPGWKATFGGLPVLADHVIDAYCVFAERVEQAGAIIVGKTNSPVMGFRGACDNYLFGPTRNPFDTSKNSGGSSGGSAAAVADGLLPFAEGTDGGGSIRIPAAWCGIYGFKPSWGRVPVVLRPDAFAGTNPFVAEGPLTRTVADAALVLQALAGYDSRDPYSLPDTPDLLAALEAISAASASRTAPTSASSQSTHASPTSSPAPCARSRRPAQSSRTSTSRSRSANASSATCGRA